MGVHSLTPTWGYTPTILQSEFYFLGQREALLLRSLLTKYGGWVLVLLLDAICCLDYLQITDSIVSWTEIHDVIVRLGENYQPTWKNFDIGNWFWDTSHAQ